MPGMGSSHENDTERCSSPCLVETQVAPATAHRYRGEADRQPLRHVELHEELDELRRVENKLDLDCGKDEHDRLDAFELDGGQSGLGCDLQQEGGPWRGRFNSPFPTQLNQLGVDKIAADPEYHHLKSG